MNKQTTDAYTSEILTTKTTIPAPSGWPVLDDRAYYGLVGDIIRSLEPYTEADPVGMLVQLLTSFGNLAGPKPHLLIGANQHPARLNVVLVGQEQCGS